MSEWSWALVGVFASMSMSMFVSMSVFITVLWSLDLLSLLLVEKKKKKKLLPTFSEKHTDWVFFRNKFVTLINNNVSSRKHWRTKHTIWGPNDTFESLWETLRKKYEIKRIIVKNHIDELFNLKHENRQVVCVISWTH
jgi:hypothetical protein